MLLLIVMIASLSSQFGRFWHPILSNCIFPHFPHIDGEKVSERKTDEVRSQLYYLASSGVDTILVKILE